jgi:hypothetical protein
VTRDTPTPSVVGTMQKSARPVAYSGGVNGRSRTANASRGVTPTMDMKPQVVPRALRRVRAVLSSSVRRVRPEMKNCGGFSGEGGGAGVGGERRRALYRVIGGRLCADPARRSMTSTQVFRALENAE